MPADVAHRADSLQRLGALEQHEGNRAMPGLGYVIGVNVVGALLATTCSFAPKTCAMTDQVTP